MYILTFEDHAIISLNEKHRAAIVYVGGYVFSSVYRRFAQFDSE